MNTETLVPDELRGDLIKEAQITILQLRTTEVASQLTLDDFKVFASIQPTEYIDKLFNIKSKYGIPNLEKFVEVSKTWINFALIRGVYVFLKAVKQCKPIFKECFILFFSLLIKKCIGL